MPEGIKCLRTNIFQNISKNFQYLLTHYIYKGNESLTLQFCLFFFCFLLFFFFLESIADDKITKLWIVSEFWCHLGSVKLNENIVIDFVTVGVEA